MPTQTWSHSASFSISVDPILAAHVDPIGVPDTKQLTAYFN